MTVSGQEMSPEAFEAFRFLTSELGREKIEGRDVIIGNAWRDSLAVATWREPDGLVVRIVGLGADLEEVRGVARAARGLDRSEWVAMVGGTSDCPFEPPPPGS